MEDFYISFFTCGMLGVLFSHKEFLYLCDFKISDLQSIKKVFFIYLTFSECNITQTYSEKRVKLFFVFFVGKC